MATVVRMSKTIAPLDGLEAIEGKEWAEGEEVALGPADDKEEAKRQHHNSHGEVAIQWCSA